MMFCIIWLNFVGKMVNICWSDGQLLLVGWSTFVGWMVHFCWLDGKLLLVGWTIFVGFNPSKAYLLSE